MDFWDVAAIKRIKTTTGQPLDFFVEWFALNIILRSTRNTLEPHSRWSQPNIVPKRAQSFYQRHLPTEPLRLEFFSSSASLTRREISSPFFLPVSVYSANSSRSLLTVDTLLTTLEKERKRERREARRIGIDH